LQNKQIRRRRAVLALLVVISLALLTDYLGAPDSSPLHSVQRGIATVLSPVQDGASKVLSPVRDVAGYFSSLFTAKSKLSQYQSDNDTLLKELAQAKVLASENQQAADILKLDDHYVLQSFGPVTATLIGYNPSLWYEQIEVDKGSSSGVRQWDPVVAPGGLIGYVSRLGSDYSIVTLITSPKFAIGAEIATEDLAAGLIQPDLGNPSTLELSDLPTNSNVSFGELVVTSGFQDPTDKSIHSIAPPGIPIGTVSSSDPQTSVVENQQVTVTPSADLQHLSVVQILTRPQNG
jgi:rod shape-determining protein MreC